MKHEWIYEGKCGPKYWRTCAKCGEQQSDKADYDTYFGFKGKEYETQCKKRKRIIKQ